MAPPNPSEVKVLVVCLGNICRSPMGEAVLKHTSKERDLDITVDSAGTAGYHIGEEPDDRTTAVCKKNRVPIDCQARQVATSDFVRFTHILAADQNNLRHLESMKPSNATAEVRLWGSYLDGKAIPDPYYGRVTGFDDCFKQCTELSNAFLDDVFGSKA